MIGHFLSNCVWQCLTVYVKLSDVCTVYVQLSNGWTVDDNCPMIGECKFNCSMIGQCMSNCPMVRQCTSNCPMIVQCTNWTMVGQCMSNCAMQWSYGSSSLSVIWTVSYPKLINLELMKMSQYIRHYPSKETLPKNVPFAGWFLVWPSHAIIQIQPFLTPG